MSDSEKMLDLNVPPEEFPVGRMEVNQLEARVLEAAYKNNPDLSGQMEQLKTNLHGLSAEPLSENEITFFWNKRKALSEDQITSLLSKRKALDERTQMASGSVSWPHTHPLLARTGRPLHQLPNIPIQKTTIAPSSLTDEQRLISKIYEIIDSREKKIFTAVRSEIAALKSDVATEVGKIFKDKD